MQEPHLQEHIAGRYIVIKTLGTGGMGRVLEVYDTVVGRAVALKVMRDEVRYRDSLARRFHREYRTMAGLQHPGVPRVFDAGADDDGRAYFTMELIHGQPLTTALASNLPPQRLLTLAAEIARILVSVHAAGVVHRDVKPQNVLLGANDRVYLVDFGAAHIVGAGEPPATPLGDTALRTAPGTWLGTPGYIDPAMLEGYPCSVRSDIYSLTATIAWMFTRVHPSAEMEAPIPTTGMEGIDRLIHRGMARNPDDRPGSTAEFLVELMATEASLKPVAQVQKGSTASHPPARKFAPGLILSLGVLGGILGGPVAGIFVHSDPPSSASVHIAAGEAPSQFIAHNASEPGAHSDSSVKSVAPDPPAALPSEPTTIPDSRRRQRAPSRHRARDEPKGELKSWADTLEDNRSILEQCLLRRRDPGALQKISTVVDGVSGHFRSISPVQLTGAPRSCIQRELAKLEFSRFPGKLELTIGLVPTSALDPSWERPDPGYSVPLLRSE